jgi:tetratricopeptide (TPR) repeat protein
MKHRAQAPLADRMRSAVEHHRAGRLLEAESLYRAVLISEPDRADALYLLGQIAGQRGELDDAAALFSSAAKADPANSVYHASLASIQYGRGRPNEAVDSYRRAIEADPRRADLHSRLGDVLLAQGRLEQARESYANALSIDANAPAVHLRLGMVLRLQGHTGAAVASYRKALSLQPDSAEAHFDLGLALMEMGSLEDAKASFQKTIASKPDSVKAYCNLGIVFSRQGRPDDALTCFQAAAAIDPAFADAFYNMGVVHAEAARIELAENCYRQALAVDPDMVSAHVNLAALLQDSGRREEAQRHRDRAYRDNCLVVESSPTAKRTVLLLMDAWRGTVPYPSLLPKKDNNLIQWMPEYAREGQAGDLPPYDVVFNVIGDADAVGPTASAIEKFVKTCDKRVLNKPEAVARTARHLLPELIGGIDGMATPRVWRVVPDGDWHGDPEFEFPLIVRPPVSHGGKGVVLATDRQTLASLEFASAEHLYLSAFHDYRSADGYYRKYRIIFVDRKPYPYHLAISDQWMVHYATASMIDHPWKQEEERSFLERPAGTLGERGMTAIEAFGERLDLDYAGADFSLLPDGRLLVFEANATMLTHPEADTGVLQWKNPYIGKIFDAFALLLEAAAD